MDQVQEALDKVSKHLELEENEEAMEIIEGAMQNNRSNPDLLTAKAKIQARMAQDNRAEKTLRKVLQIAPDHEGAVCALGRLLDSMLRTDEAKELYKSYMRRNPGKHEVVDDYVRILVSEEKYDQALDLARGHAESYPQEIGAYKAIRSLLFIIENEIRDDYEDNDLDPRCLVDLAENFAEQYETIITIDDEVHPDSPDIQQDINEEYLRISGEIESIVGEIDRSEYSISRGLRKRLEDIVDDCAEKRDF